MGLLVKPSGPQSGLPAPPAALGGTLKLLLAPPLSVESQFCFYCYIKTFDSPVTGNCPGSVLWVFSLFVVACNCVFGTHIVIILHYL